MSRNSNLQVWLGDRMIGWMCAPHSSDGQQIVVNIAEDVKNAPSFGIEHDYTFHVPDMTRVTLPLSKRYLRIPEHYIDTMEAEDLERFLARNNVPPFAKGYTQAYRNELLYSWSVAAVRDDYEGCAMIETLFEADAITFGTCADEIDHARLAATGLKPIDHLSAWRSLSLSISS